MTRLCKFVLQLLFVTIVVSSPVEQYFEELDIVPLPHGFLSATFKFLTRHRGPLGNHYDLFPKMIGEILQRYSVEEFHLSMSQNYWRTYQWGYQPPPGAPTGAQLWAWFKENDTAEIDTQWRDFVHALSGTFCASFSQIDTRRLTVRPEHEFRPRGVLSGKSAARAANNRYLRYAVLPSDNVCTENLTPWKKLLPCKSRAGIGGLLIGTRLFSASYTSLNVNVRRICDAGASGGKCVGEKNVVWELTQTLTVVFDMESGGRSGDWTLYGLFGHTISSICSVANSSKVFVDLQHKIFNLKPTLATQAISNGNRRRYAVYDVAATIEKFNEVNIGATYSKDPSSITSVPPPIHIHSFVAGAGFQAGRLVSRIFNSLPVEVPVLYSHNIPWFLRTYYHTLQIDCNGKIVEPKFVKYQPARDRKRPHMFEIAFELPAESFCDLSMNFERSLLRVGEYPPDANRGWPIAAPMISFYNPSVANHTLLLTSEEPLLTFSCAGGNTTKKSISKSAFTVVYGKSLLVNIPTPDFSMPYNVICLVCTVVALAFGPIHSLTTKTLTIIDPARVEKNRATEFVKKCKEVLKEIGVEVKEWFLTTILRRKVPEKDKKDEGEKKEEETKKDK